MGVVRGRPSAPAPPYILSTGRAFAATDRRALRGYTLQRVLEQPSGRARLSGRVILTNLPGNLAR